MRLGGLVLICLLAAAALAARQPPPASAAAAVAEALLWHLPMPAPDRTAALPGSAQKTLTEYRRREASFRSALAPPRGGSDEERALHEQRVAIERELFSLFRGGDVARIAASYAFDADLDREAAFIDRLLHDLPVPWLAPYLNLISGHRKLCEGESMIGRRQLAYARDAGHPLIRMAAEQLLNDAGRPFDSPRALAQGGPPRATTVRWCSPSPSAW